MEKPKFPDPVPTKSELDVLTILWTSGPSTVRFVHDTLNSRKDAVQYTSTLKLMQVMAEKGMLSRDETQMKHIYTPLLDEEKTKGSMLGRFVDTIYDGSVSNLMMALLENEKTSESELIVLRELVKKLKDAENKKG